MKIFSAAKLVPAALAIGAAAVVCAQLGTTSAVQFAPVHGWIPKTAKAGHVTTARIAVDVPAGFHIYSPSFTGTGVPTSITLAASKGGKLTKVVSPKGGELSGKVVFEPKIAIAKSAKGHQTFDFTIRFQQCNEKICLPPKTEHIKLTTNVR